MKEETLEDKRARLQQFIKETHKSKLEGKTMDELTYENIMKISKKKADQDKDIDRHYYTTINTTTKTGTETLNSTIGDNQMDDWLAKLYPNSISDPLSSTLAF